MPYLIIETPRAGPWNHRFIISQPGALNEVQLGSYIAAARSQTSGADYLAVHRTVVQRQTGRQGEEMLALVGLEVGALGAGQQTALHDMLTQLLATEVEQLIASTIAWEAEGRQNPVVRPELLAWENRLGVAQLCATKLRPGQSPKPSQLGRKPLAVGAAVALLLAGGVWWSGVIEDTPSEPWERGLKALYPDSGQYEKAAQEFQKLGVGDQEKLKKLLNAWAESNQTCLERELKVEDIWVLTNKPLANTAMKCAEAVQARQQLAQFNGDTTKPPALPFVTTGELTGFQQKQQEIIARANNLSAEVKADCPSKTDYALVACLAQLSGSSSQPYQSKNELAYSDEACGKLGFGKTACDAAANEAAIEQKIAELRTAEEQAWQQAQQKKQARLAEQLKPFQEFHTKLSGPDYQALRKLLGIEQYFTKP